MGIVTTGLQLALLLLLQKEQLLWQAFCWW